VQNVSALIKKHTGEDITHHDIHIQFIGTYEGVEGDSASISVAAAVISALEGIPIDQTVAMTGSLSIRGHVLPVGGITAKIEAAAEVGMKKVIIPGQNLKDVLIRHKYLKRIQIIPAYTLRDVLDNVLVGSPAKVTLLQKLAKLAPMGIPEDGLADGKGPVKGPVKVPGGIKAIEAIGGDGEPADDGRRDIPAGLDSPAPGGG
jgi:Lon-like ATP-dependent protease